MRTYFGKSVRRKLAYIPLLALICVAFLDNHLLPKGDKDGFIQRETSSSTTKSEKHTRDSLIINGRPFNGTLLNETEYFDLLLKPSGFFCKKLITIGGFSCRKYVDGDKQVCLDDRIRPPMKECLVYSFGVGDDITFEGAMDSLFGCEIHLFDPTINATWLLEENLGNSTHYHAMGLSDENKVIEYVGGNKSLSLSTFDNILNDNGHTGRTIHYLKMDIESAEWMVLPYMIDRGLLDNVHQLAIEIHVDTLEKIPYSEWLPTLQRRHDVLSRLESIGFRKISYRPNINAVGFIQLPFEKTMRPACGEIFYVRDSNTIRKASNQPG